ncbi:MAG: hypothetical protein ABIR79_07185, partial [Candidatus Binatia bacterium]
AEQALDAPTLSTHRADLETRFAAAHLRNDTRQLREESRFALLIQRDAAAALTIAERNWQAQREPEDARLVLSAATAAGKPAAAADVRQWIGDHRLEDRRLAPLTPDAATATRTHEATAGEAR